MNRRLLMKTAVIPFTPFALDSLRPMMFLFVLTNSHFRHFNLMLIFNNFRISKDLTALIDFELKIHLKDLLQLISFLM